MKTKPIEVRLTVYLVNGKTLSSVYSRTQAALRLKWARHLPDFEDYALDIPVADPAEKVATPGAFYVQGKQVFIGHAPIADCIDAVYAARVADALNYRKVSK